MDSKSAEQTPTLSKEDIEKLTKIKCRTFCRGRRVPLDHTLKPKTISEEDAKITNLPVNATFTGPYSYSSLRAAYGYPAYPAPISGVKRITLGIIDAYLYRTIDGSSNLAKSAAPYDLTTLCTKNNFAKPNFLAPITLTSTVSPIVFPNSDTAWFVEAAASNCTLDPDDTSELPGWSQEEALDFQDVFGMTNIPGESLATGPNIVLIHANSPYFSDFQTAINQAIALGCDILSLSWGGPEFPNESYFDSIFNNAAASKVTILAATGDAGFASYPAISPYVIAVGGTSLVLNSNNQRVSESAWGSADGSDGNGGGGVSGDNTGDGTLPVQEGVPNYQSKLGYKGRATPDMGFFSDPYPGVANYLANLVAPGSSSIYSYSEYYMGGTSSSTPCVAALIAISNQMRINAGKKVLTTLQVLKALYWLYDNYANPNYCFNIINNVTTGSTYLYEKQPDGTYKYVLNNSCSVSNGNRGYDLATGIGSPTKYLAGYLASLA